MERSTFADGSALPGYDILCARPRYIDDERAVKPVIIQPSRAYDAYHNLDKVYVDYAEVQTLRSIHESLRDEKLPDYLDVAAWSAAEAALIGNESVDERCQLLESAEDCWQKAIVSQENMNRSDILTRFIDDSGPFRYAINLACTPLIKAIIEGDVSRTVRESTFVDVLAITESAHVQRFLAHNAGSTRAASDMLGFEYECNALLTLLHMDDPRHVPLPSSARAGSGTSKPHQTHDMVVVNQHWGKILKVIPVEVKARASLRDIGRYEALIVRGKMHLSSDNFCAPEHTRKAFEACYNGNASKQQKQIVSQVEDTFLELLQMYQKGKRTNRHSGVTRFHDRSPLMREHPELSFNRARPCSA